MSHEPRELRELRFTAAVHAILQRGGKCLIPVFALGRSQELLLILDAYWRDHPELHKVPLYYASGIAKRCMRIYQTYINMMNENIRDAHATGRNPWEFEFVRNLPSSAQFNDSQPMVVMASPGMLQQGLSRELFELWCSDRRNGLVMPGYSVVGTLANHLLSEPKEIQTSGGDWVAVNLTITYVSFSAHSDFTQTSEFISATRPRHVIHVHGGEEEMKRLARALAKQYNPKEVEFLTPQNCQPVQLRFPGEKIARVVGSLAEEEPSDGAPLEALLLLKENKYTLLAPADLHTATDLATTRLLQRPRFRFERPPAALLSAVGRIFEVGPPQPALLLAEEGGGGGGGGSGGGGGGGEGGGGGGGGGGGAVETGGEQAGEEGGPSALARRWLVQGLVAVEVSPASSLAVLEWEADPIADTVADAVSALLLQLQAQQLPEVAAAEEPAGGGGGGEGGGGGGGGGLDFALRVLAEQFGAVEEEEAGGARRLQVAGHAVRLHGASLPFERIESESELALQRVRDVLARALDACRPVAA